MRGALTRDRGHDVDWVYAASASLAVVAVSQAFGVMLPIAECRLRVL